MSEPVTTSDISQVIDLLKAIDKKLDVHIAVTAERFNTLETKFEGAEKRLETKIEGVRQELDAKIDGLRQGLETKFEGVEKRLETKIEGVRQELDAKIDGLRQEVRSLDTKVDELSKRQGATDSRLWALLVGLFLTVAGLLAKITLFDRV